MPRAERNGTPPAAATRRAPSVTAPTDPTRAWWWRGMRGKRGDERNGKSGG
jgi:hypothetical protein